jgi:hypothetical protein
MMSNSLLTVPTPASDGRFRGGASLVLASVGLIGASYSMHHQHRLKILAAIEDAEDYDTRM